MPARSAGVVRRRSLPSFRPEISPHSPMSRAPDFAQAIAPALIAARFLRGACCDARLAFDRLIGDQHAAPVGEGLDKVDGEAGHGLFEAAFIDMLHQTVWLEDFRRLPKLGPTSTARPGKERIEHSMVTAPR
jgi:hypothetical protein